MGRSKSGDGMAMYDLEDKLNKYTKDIKFKKRINPVSGSFKYHSEDTVVSGAVRYDLCLIVESYSWF